MLIYHLIEGSIRNRCNWINIDYIIIKFNRGCICMVDISIIIPVYNVEEYLEDALNSILHQDLKNYEVILVDDGSTDLGGVICDEYASLYRSFKVIHQENRGQSYAMNIGRLLSSGKYIYYMDADDILVDGALTKMYEIAEKTKADVVFIDAYMQAPDGKRIALKSHIDSKNIYDVYDTSKDRKELYTNYRYLDCIAYWFSFCRADIYRDIPCPSKKASDCYFQFQRLRLAKKVVFLHECLYIYRNPRPGSITTLGRTKQFDLEHIDRQIFQGENIFNYFGKNADFLAKRYIIAYYHIDFYIKDGSMDFVKDYIIKRLKSISKYCGIKNRIRIFAMVNFSSVYKYRSKRIL